MVNLQLQLLKVALKDHISINLQSRTGVQPKLSLLTFQDNAPKIRLRFARIVSLMFYN
jgi:hypothetical protein